MNMVYISYAMGTCGLPDIYTLSPWACSPWALGVYIRQTTRAHGITITYTFKLFRDNTQFHGPVTLLHYLRNAFSVTMHVSLPYKMVTS